MKPQNISVRVLRMNAPRIVFEVTFTVHRDMPGVIGARYPDGEAVDDQVKQICAAVEGLEVDVGDEVYGPLGPTVVARDSSGRPFSVLASSLCSCGFVHGSDERCGPY
jgi:hypothetical protein